MCIIMHAVHNPDQDQRNREIEFAKRQMDYALGSTGRSFVGGFGVNPPVRQHHCTASCPDLPDSCGPNEFSSPDPNPQELTGALSGGPGGVKLMKDYAKKNPPIIITDPDATYFDKRNDYEVSVCVLFRGSSLCGVKPILLRCFFSVRPSVSPFAYFDFLFLFRLMVRYLLLDLLFLRVLCLWNDFVSALSKCMPLEIGGCCWQSLVFCSWTLNCITFGFVLILYCLLTQTNEVACDYNAGFTTLLAALIKLLG